MLSRLESAILGICQLTLPNKFLYIDECFIYEPIILDNFDFDSKFPTVSSHAFQA